MQTLTEKRVFGTKTGTTEVFVGTETGLVVVTVSADQIGTFGLTDREPVTAVAADSQQVLVGGDGGLRVSRLADADRASSPPELPLSAVGDDSLDQIVAVGIGPTGPLVGDADGEVYALATDGNEDRKWQHVGTTAGVNAIDGALVAADDGVYRVTDGELDHVGLDSAADVAGHGVPQAATSEGLFRLGNGWLSVADGAFSRVAGDGHGHASAVASDGLRTRADEDGDWTADALPVDEPIVDLAYGSGIRAAITESGTLCINAGDGWRHQRLGLPSVTGVAVAGAD
ncbi:hypothetical protein EGH24_03000 [Halonotius terrestris]|uniref:HVO-0234-like beta-propeller domain-containing protein n=1 Tax=Halonotius terrestris TaxID=2487750 RepID=A0A8J8PEE2_9EURY|nr:hypothetical protein [Halonotius terrestris]TQQ83765.1 hypothetical protein EGH24_03000 [Halonotius terrestris]